LDAFDLAASLDRDAAGTSIHRLIAELFPICRSITGDGVRRTLEIVGRHGELEVHEVPSGTAVLDWEVPPEWNIREAWIEGPSGDRIVDLADSTLHVVGYSVPIRERLTLEELRPRLHSIPEHPSWIPYRTSYYAPTWGFCLQQERLEQLPDGEYEVCIDSELAPGSLTYGEMVVPGRTDREVLLSAHVCHPSLANDNLSGVAVAATLAELLRALELRNTYRFVFAPGTIGAITWLARNRDRLDWLRAGLVLTCLGDSGGVTYKRSRRGDAEIDRAVEAVIPAQPGSAIRSFSPDGYDERQYCSPGFDLPVGCLMRTPHGEYPEYHTSADDLELVQPEALADSLCTLLRIVGILEANDVLANQQPFGEPQLGRRGLYRTVGGRTDSSVDEKALLWVLNLADGEHDLLAIAERSGMSFDAIRAAATQLAEHDLVESVTSSEPA
jgi:aminopeptidase-like protein